MSVRPEKYHIYNFDLEPLCWEEDDWDCERAIEFDSAEETTEFLDLVERFYPLVYEELWGFKKDILYYNDYIPGALALELMKKELKEDRGIEI